MQFFRSKFFFPIIVFILMMAFSWYGFEYLQKSSVSGALESFNISIDETTNCVNERLHDYSSFMKSLSAFYASSQSVERVEFNDFVSSQSVSQELPGFTAVSYAEYTPEDKVLALEKAVQEDRTLNGLGYPDFKVNNLIPGEPSMPIVYIYPEDKFYGTLGYNIWTDPVRGNVARLSIKNNSVVISPLITTITEKKQGLFLTLSVKTADENSSQLFSGVVNGIINVQSFFVGIFKDIKTRGIRNIVVSDITEDPEVLYHTAIDQADSSLSDFTQEKVISFGGRKWKLLYEGMIDQNRSPQEILIPIVALSGGFVFAVLIFVLLYLLFSQKEKIQNEARNLAIRFQESEGQFVAITNSVSDAIVVMDNNAKITFWNNGAEMMFGYKAKEVMGKPLHPLIAAEKEHGTKKDRLQRFGATGESEILNKTIDLPVKTKSGRRLTVQLTVSRVKIKGSWHAVGVMRDITENKKIQEELASRNDVLEKMNRLSVGREMKMRELKEELNKYKK